MIPNSEHVLWQCYSFKELTTIQLYDLLHLRSEVFIIEQNCPYQDLDYRDLEASHLLATAAGKLVAYCRILPPGISYADAASIGRVVTPKTVRGRGIGRCLMLNALKICTSRYEGKDVKISAQLYLKDFYRSLGFQQITETYLEDNIPHIGMLFKNKEDAAQ